MISDIDGTPMNVGDSVEAINLTVVQSDQWGLINGVAIVTIVAELTGANSGLVSIGDYRGTPLTPPPGHGNAFYPQRFRRVEAAIPNY